MRGTFGNAFSTAKYLFDAPDVALLKIWLKETATKVRALSARLGVPSDLAAMARSISTCTVAGLDDPSSADYFPPRQLDWLEHLGGFPPPIREPRHAEHRQANEIFFHLAVVAASLIDPIDVRANKTYWQDGFVNQGQRKAFSAAEDISLAVERVPAVLGLVSGLCDRAALNARELRTMDTVERSFRRHLFLGLRRTYERTYGVLPPLQNSSRAPAGIGVKWAKAAIGLARDKVEKNIGPGRPPTAAQDKKWRITARRLLLDAAGLRYATIASRLRDPQGRTRNKRR